MAKQFVHTSLAAVMSDRVVLVKNKIMRDFTALSLCARTLWSLGCASQRSGLPRVRACVCAQLQTIVSRSLDPMERAVLTVRRRTCPHLRRD